MNVLILEIHADTYAEGLRRAFPDVTFIPVKRAAELSLDLTTVDVLIAFGMGINDDLIRRATGLKWIQSLATGVDHFLRCPSLRSEVLLTSGRGIHGPAMRETVAYMLLNLSHDTRRLVQQQTDHRWDRSRPWPLLAGKTAVIAGVGYSSTEVARLLKALGMRVVGVSRTPRAIDGFDDVLPTSGLLQAAAQADYLINVLPGDAHNAGLIGRDVFAAMKPTAYFVNVGRGETVDEAALIAALSENRIAGAGLDVFAKEPLPGDSPLWDLPNVFLTSHIAGLFREYEDYAMPIIVENMRLFIGRRHDEMRNRIAH